VEAAQNPRRRLGLCPVPPAARSGACSLAWGGGGVMAGRRALFLFAYDLAAHPGPTPRAGATGSIRLSEVVLTNEGVTR